MGYQALLFCSDEKLARVVTQVFSELDFAVEPVHEPFAAVKKLMTQHYDAIVVDCENEQNASLLFKSARNSSFNQSSLAIAVVEGQAGVAKSYRIGANLVLTKPINVEQAKGTLRVARGLLRKNSDAAGASAPATPAKPASVSAASSFPPASRSSAAAAPPPSPHELPEFEAPMAASMREALAAELPTELPRTTALAKVEHSPAAVPAPAAQSKTAIAAEPALESRQPESAGTVQNDGVKDDVAKNEAANAAATSVPAQSASSAVTSAPGSAAAPAPAKEVTAPPAKENKIVESKTADSKSVESKTADSKTVKSKVVQLKIFGSEPASASHGAAPVPLPTSNAVSTTGAPSFAVALDEDDSWGSGGFQKILMVVIAVLALAALGYLGYSELGKSSKPPAPRPVSLPQESTQPAPALASTSSPAAAPSTSTPAPASTATPTLAPKTAPPEKPSAGASKSPAIRIDAKVNAHSEPGTKKPDSAPLLVKSGTKVPAQAEESDPSLPGSLTIESADDSNLKGLISSASSNPPKPSLATVKLSQGVAQGLLIKQVQPTYPPAALKLHAQGAVQIEATINKEGIVINPKVLRGDHVLAGAALDAVRQWRYKPYYLDGEPVEIQTQITVNFKAN